MKKVVSAYKLNRYSLGAGLLIFCLLLVSGWSLGIRIAAVKKNNLNNLTALNQALPGFNNKSLEQLRQEIKNLKRRLVNLADIFDPKEKWLKKDYDLSIYFVEELSKINQSLKNKAIDRQVNLPELGFKEKLPSESEALYLLSQLYGLKEVINLGLDYSVDFKSFNPLGIEESGKITGMRLAKTRMELTCPAQGLIEFILQLNEIIPRPYTESLSLKSQDSQFEVSLSLSHIVIDQNWRDKQELYASTDTKEALPETGQDLTRILRGNNPFFVPAAKEPSSLTQEQAQAPGKPEKPKPISRFLFRGRAVLKSKEVVVIEDTLNQETVFLGRGEKIDNFILDRFSNDEATLKNLDNGQEIVIRREER